MHSDRPQLAAAIPNGSSCVTDTRIIPGNRVQWTGIREYRPTFLLPPAHPHPRGFIYLSQDTLKPTSQTSLHISLLPAAARHTQPARSVQSKVSPSIHRVPRVSRASTGSAGAGAWCDTGQTRCPLCSVSGSETPLHCQPFSERRDMALGCCGNSHVEMGLTGSFIPCHAMPGRVTEVPAAPRAQAHTPGCVTALLSEAQAFSLPTLLFRSPGNASSHVQGVTHGAGRAVGVEGGRVC